MGFCTFSVKAQGPPGQGQAGPDSFEGNYRRTLMLVLLSPLTDIGTPVLSWKLHAGVGLLCVCAAHFPECLWTSEEAIRANIIYGVSSHVGAGN